MPAPDFVIPTVPEEVLLANPLCQVLSPVFEPPSVNTEELLVFELPSACEPVHVTAPVPLFVKPAVVAEAPA